MLPSGYKYVCIECEKLIKKRSQQEECSSIRIWEWRKLAWQVAVLPNICKKVQLNSDMLTMCHYIFEKCFNVDMITL